MGTQPPPSSGPCVWGLPVRGVCVSAYNVVRKYVGACVVCVMLGVCIARAP